MDPFRKAWQNCHFLYTTSSGTMKQAQVYGRFCTAIRDPGMKYAMAWNVGSVFYFYTIYSTVANVVLFLINMHSFTYIKSIKKLPGTCESRRAGLRFWFDYPLFFSFTDKGRSRIHWTVFKISDKRYLKEFELMFLYRIKLMLCLRSCKNYVKTQ